MMTIHQTVRTRIVTTIILIQTCTDFGFGTPAQCDIEIEALHMREQDWLPGTSQVTVQ